MDDLVEETFANLKNMDQPARRSLLCELHRAGFIVANAFALYRHHVIPAITAEQRALAPSAVSLHYAKIQCGLRWAGLHDEQSSFWQRHTLRLFQGDLAPLCTETYERFLARDYHALIPEPSVTETSELVALRAAWFTGIKLQVEKLRTLTDQEKAPSTLTDQEKAPSTLTDQEKAPITLIDL